MKYDLPATAEQFRTPDYNPVGPGRTEPFVTLDNEILNLPASHNRGFSKIPAVFREKDRPWARFDGSVKRPNTRSGLAAMTAGGSVDNLGGLGIGRNIIAAAAYTVEELAGSRWVDNLGGLGIGRNIIAAAAYTVVELAGPRWVDIFGAPAEPPAGGEARPGDVDWGQLGEAQRKGRELYA